MENSDQRLFTLLGTLSADVKHILRALQENERRTDELRRDMLHGDTELRKDIIVRDVRLHERLTRVETFNTRVLTYATVAFALLVPAVNWGVPFVLSFIS